MANMIKGEEYKFAIDITAPGFSMDNDDFDVEIASPKKKTIVGHKVGAVPDTTEIYKTGSADVSICRMPDEDGNTGEWFVVIVTQDLNTGELNLTTTAHIVDNAAADGVRNSLARKTLGNLIA